MWAFACIDMWKKLSWKWFANIANGLLLVTYMGRLIEYFDGDASQGYYIGVWSDGATETGGMADSRLANAFADIYYVYGDTRESVKGLRDFSEAIAADEEARKARYYADDGTAETPEEAARKFCQGTSSSGWANFTSCIKDIVSTAKKVANTVQTAASTAQDMYNRYQNVKDNAANIKQAIESMKGGSLTDIIAGTGNILNNISSAVSTTTGAVGSFTHAASNISNNIQDMGKRTDQQQQM